MKKIITSLILVIISIITIAQTKTNTESTDHLTFKGVPIDGTLSDYISKMEDNGFTLVRSEDGMAILQGDFASYKNCIIGVATLKQKDLVSKITVVFPDQVTWSSLSFDYFALKEMLTKKYGKPSDYVEKFDGSVPRDDNSKMYEVQFDRCKYYSTYEIEKGTIQLSIEHDGVIHCFVMLAYYDKINGEIIKANAIDDL